MARKSASVFGDTPNEDIDISLFAPKSAPAPAAPTKEQVKAASEAINFPSREAPKPKSTGKAVREPRRHRTGRNVQFNAKASQGTIERFYALCDRTGWVMGYTLERAVEALERELNNES